MVSINGFTSLDLIHSGRSSSVYRAVNKASHAPCVLKVLHDSECEKRRARFQYEYKIVANKDIEGIVKPADYIEASDCSCIVLSDSGNGVSLDHVLADKKLTFKESLNIAVGCCKALYHLHQQRIIHRDIKPANFIYYEKTKEIKLIDFGLSTTLTELNQELVGLNTLEGSFPYISPEQTGRMNRKIDLRTDLYSMGVTLFELFTNKLPFYAEDDIGWVHCHIAKPAPKAKDLNGNIPALISKIINKLLNKRAEERYQTAYGLLCDLSDCLKNYSEYEEIKEFRLGRSDQSDRLSIPEKLYGREKEVQQLQDIFERSTSEEAGLLLIGGASGIGKSILVHELYKPLVEKKGIFISGKNDQFKRSTPYFALRQAISQLIKQVLLLPDEELNQLRNCLLAKLEGQAQLLIEIVPEIEKLVGKQESAAKMDSDNIEDRIKSLFSIFFGHFVSENRPLVLFLDDMQWTDLASLSLIKHLIAVYGIKNLLLIFAFRDNEVSEGDPFVQVCEDLRSECYQSQISLKPLWLPDTLLLVEDTLGERSDRVSLLAEFLQNTTEGNPLFISELLKNWHQENLIYLNSKQQTWDWDLATISASAVKENLVDLLLSKLNKMPTEIQQTLKLASCAGANFRLYDLIAVSEKTVSKLMEELWLVMQQSFLIPDNDDLSEYECSSAVTIEDSRSIVYRFSHDRIQQAAHQLMSEDERAETHLKIATNQIKHYSESEIHDSVFTIADHFNYGASKVTTPELKRIRSDLNEHAAEKALASAAFKSGLQYVRTSLELLEDNAWEIYYDKCIKLYSLASTIAYRCAEESLLDDYTQKIFEHAKNAIDATTANILILRNKEANHDFAGAVRYGIECLEAFGIKIPKRGRKIANAIVHLKFIAKATPRIASIDPETFDYKRFTYKPEINAVTELMEAFRHSRYSPNTQYGFLVDGVVMNWYLKVEPGKIPLALFFYFAAVASKSKLVKQAKAVLPIVEKILADPVFQKDNCSRSYYARCAFSRFSKTYDTLIEKFKSFELLAQTLGERFINEMARWTHLQYVFCSGIMPDKLSLDRFVKLSTHSKEAISGEKIFTLFIDEYKNSTTFESDLIAKRFDTNTFREQVEVGKDILLIYYYPLAVQYYWYAENYERCISLAEQNEKSIKNIEWVVIHDYYCLYLSLARLMLVEDKGQAKSMKSARKKIPKEVQKQLSLFKKASQIYERNFIAKAQILEAVICSVKGDDIKARELYEAAIDNAKKHENHHELALAYDLYGRFCVEHKQNLVAKYYLLKAIEAYTGWGLNLQANNLLDKYSAIIGDEELDFDLHSSIRNAIQNERLVGLTKESSPNEKSLIYSNTASSLSSMLDLTSIIKSSQAIASEIRLDSLIKTMMQLVLENAGAQNGLLFIQKSEALFLKLSANLEANQYNPEDQSLTDSATECPTRLIQYVVRSGEFVILNDAKSDSEFGDEEYIRKNDILSVICFPVINQGKCLGCIYLENNLTTSAFTDDHLQTLKMLASQAAVSLENALLYRSLEDKVAERTAELKSKNDDIESMLSNIEQGLFTLSKEGEIHPEYSKHLETILRRIILLVCSMLIYCLHALIYQ